MPQEIHPFRPVEIRFLTEPTDGTSNDMLILDHATGHFVRMNLDGAEVFANAILDKIKAIKASKK